MFVRSTTNRYWSHHRRRLFSNMVWDLSDRRDSYFFRFVVYEIGGYSMFDIRAGRLVTDRWRTIRTIFYRFGIEKEFHNSARGLSWTIAAPKATAIEASHHRPSNTVRERIPPEEIQYILCSSGCNGRDARPQVKRSWDGSKCDIRLREERAIIVWISITSLHFAIIWNCIKSVTRKRMIAIIIRGVICTEFLMIAILIPGRDLYMNFCQFVLCSLCVRFVFWINESAH